ncbi:MAG: hypothetical protein AAGA43_04495 [Bacteroidota bacterium]
MELKQKKIPNKLNEQYILPIFFLLVNITVILWFYIVYEYSQSNRVFENYYSFDQSSIENYKRELELQILLLTLVLLISSLWLKYRRRWFLVAITLAHAGFMYYFFYM